jgi:ubiquinone/menaquinone biosynthesis C-methylase UbiE
MKTKQLQQLTEEHYESFPFEFLTDEDAANIESLQPFPFKRFVDDRLKVGMKVAEIGCGPGRGTLFLVRRKLDVVAVDLSKEALRLAEQRAPEATFVHASNLELPFDDESFDAVVSDGVIHHTPDPHQSLRENARILKHGGDLYLGVYRRKRYYYYVYTHLGRPVRWLEKRILGRALIYSTLLPVY